MTLNDDSVTFWLRSPKIHVEETGDLVEVYGVKQRPDLDPLSVLASYLARRREK